MVLEVKPIELMSDVRTNYEDQFADEKEITQHAANSDFVNLKSSLDNLSVTEALRTYKKAVLLCLTAGFTAIVDGYQLTLNGSIVSNKGFIAQMSDPGTTIINASYVSAWGGIHSAGQFLGQVSLQYVSDRLGRKKALYLLWVIMAVSVAIECASRNWQTWLVAKLLAGTGVGMVQATLPLYIAEHSPNQLRGLFTNAYTFWFVVGQILSPLCLREISLYRPYDWLVAVYTQWGLLAFMIVIFFFLPESPWWLVAKGRVEQAEVVLQKYRGHIAGYDVKAETQIMLATLEAEKRNSEENNLGGTFSIFKGTNGWRLLIAAWPKIMQQLVGLSVFNNYSTYFFQIAGNNNPFQVTMILACVQIIGMLVVASFTDKYGRRPFVIGGYSITVCAVLALGVVGFFNYAGNPAIGNLLVVFACFATFSTTGASAIGYTYLTEVPSQTLRARTAGWGLASSNLLAIMFSFTVPLMLKGSANWGPKAALFFAGTGFPCVIAAYFLLPETARRSPAEIDEMFAKKVSPRHFKSYVTEAEQAQSQGELSAKQQEQA